ncbi:MAG: cell envelope integrity EipB family protein [Proteobacteria bacterium]|nr:cell envelope integrity EipB family protein [Pseudomonadota bacterium]
MIASISWRRPLSAGFGGLILGLALFLAGPPALAGIYDLVPHRAAYALSLGRSDSGSGVEGARGAMVIEWDESCEGWTVRQRIALDLALANGGGLRSETAYTSWESLDGREYSFRVKSKRNGEDTETFAGEAALDADGAGEARYSDPEGRVMALPAGTLFPTAHTVKLLEQAEAGDPLLFAVVFDGATEEGAARINAVIGRPVAPGAADAPESIAGVRGWRMRLAFFDFLGKKTEPHYELGVVLLENGVARSLEMDYGDFVIDATLERVEPVAKPDC